MRSDVLAYLAEQARLPFEWGKTDCVQFAAGMIERLSGTRPRIREYSSEVGAKRVLADMGGLEAAVSSFLGPAQSDLRLCGDGDIVLTAFQGQHALGIAVPHWFFVRRQTDGSLVDLSVAPVDLSLAIRWWPCRPF